MGWFPFLLLQTTSRKMTSLESGRDGLGVGVRSASQCRVERRYPDRKPPLIRRYCDHTKLVGVVERVADAGGYICTSTDSGATWTQQTVLPNVPVGSYVGVSVASSSDGTKLVAVVDDGYIYTSSGPVP
jgi:hypothetical protein